MTNQQPFTHTAKAQTMARDINVLRKAIRSFDAEAADKALDDCERWLSCLSSVDHADRIRRFDALPEFVQAQVDALLGRGVRRGHEDEGPGKPWTMDGIGRVTIGRGK